ncbi:hypothetical protein Acsp06_43880 [Actinomycetospora sp. NBRC 106375]|uniref:hypothetical protein n=1 Tax=Actinomycetospora sp. NBRC 106375 TaxID=3032207 RepID=UPI0024A20C68|nr:hypothetical protein [Actinomycetospora sp. NBRC 106375]GLZ48203.1 hypothetical protein Acsp06_43880 [Actinomycetospora sp. NBRC 106375]
MPSLGLRLTVLTGSTVPVPLPGPLAARVRSVQVTESDEDRSVFTVTLDAGRSSTDGALDPGALAASPLRAFARVVLVVTFGALPQVLADGIVTEVRWTPGDHTGEATLSVTGEDVSTLMDRTERDVEHPGLDDYPQVLAVLARYAADGIYPLAVPTPATDPPLPIDRIPTQHGTDLEHLVTLARRHGYAAYALPGPTPGTSRFYWGPPVRAGVQGALSVDLGPETNVVSMSFRAQAWAPVTVSGAIVDRRTDTVVPVVAAVPSRPPLSAVPLWASAGAQRGERRLRDPGSDAISAQARAQGEVDRSVDAVVAEGELDGARYGAVLRPRALVGVRGAGWSHDGLWYVRRVAHTLAPGSFRQAFTLSRDGYGSTLPAVPVTAVG